MGNYFSTYKQMLIELDRKSISYSNDNEAINILKVYGYYNLVTNYKNTLSDKNNRFHVSLNDLVILREFDMELQNLLFKYILQIETTIKSHFSYRLSEKYGVEMTFFKNKDNYLKKNQAEYTYRRLDEKWIKKEKDPVKYYMDTYYNIPPWVYLKQIPFGENKNLLKVLKNNDFNYIVNEMISSYPNLTIKNKINFFNISLKLLHEFRNSIAHGDRLLNFTTKSKFDYNIFKEIFPYSVLNRRELNVQKDKVFIVLLIIINLLPFEFQRKHFFLQINNMYKEYLDVYGQPCIQNIHRISELPMDFLIRLDESTIQFWDDNTKMRTTNY